jgi:hypothetical protein
MKISHKLIISYIGIILITSLLYVYFKQKTTIQEGSLSGDISKSIMGGIRPIIDNATGPFRPLISIVNNLGEELNKMPTRINNINVSIKSFGESFEVLFVNPGKSIALVGKDVGNIVDNVETTTSKYLTQFFEIYIASIGICLGDKLANLPSCFGIYVLQIIGYILYYMTIGLPIYLIDLGLGLNLTKIIFDFFELMQTLILEIYGTHITAIIKKCYSCNISPLPQFNNVPIKNAVNTLKHDYNTTIPGYMNEIKTKFQKSGTDFTKIFN